MKIVRFKDGLYAIRKKCLFGKYAYLSLRRDFWWKDSEAISDYCKSDLNTVKQRLIAYTDVGEPI